MVLTYHASHLLCRRRMVSFSVVLIKRGSIVEDTFFDLVDTKAELSACVCV